ncbi:MAG: flagellar basal body rod protein FlgB [Limnochordia bacterium]|jgi:flagellar basal-body rod protein FlgB|nr:flagellar basal body rod protein FlgB [Bacillota bacterium]
MASFDATEGLLVRAMDYAAARSRALAANIANANTPGYKRVDVSFATHLSEAKRLPLARSHEAHLAGRRETASIEYVQEGGTTMRNDGNNVDLEREMAFLVNTSMFYNAVLDQYNRRLASLRAAINEGRR